MRHALPAALLLATTAASADPPDWSKLTLHAFADVYYGFDFNRPSDGASFAPGQGSTAKRSNEIGLNLAALTLSYAPDPVGVELAVVFGNGTEVLHGAELTSTDTGPSVWHNIYRAALTFKHADFSLEAGIYPSHIGYESFFSKDNWNYTRGWDGENVPYYQAGLKLAYAFDAHWSAQFHIVNGYQQIGDLNEMKTLGTQIAWTSDALSASFNTLMGPESPGDNDHWRFLLDLVAQWNVTAKLAFGTQLDAGFQQRPNTDSAAWQVMGLYARYALTDVVAVAARFELYHDADGVITGTSQFAGEGTLTLALTPVSNLTVKLEGRYDRSDATVFTLHELDGAGNPTFGKDEFLLVLGAVAGF